MMKYFGRERRGTSNKQQYFGDNPDHDTDPGIFKGNFYLVG